MVKVLKKFKPLYITIGILAGLIAICLLRRSLISEKTSYSDAITDQRVFDYGELLTDEEEEKLQKLIDKRQRQTGYDIVLVTLDMDVSDYNKIDRADIFDRPYEDIMDERGSTYRNDFYQWAYESDYDRMDLYLFQRAFWDEYRFGFDGHPKGRTDVGKGVIFVDNWYNEQTWFGTSGDDDLIYKYEKNDAAASTHMLKTVGKRVESNPYEAYKFYINTFYYDMTEWIPFNIYINRFWPLILGIVIAVIAYLIRSSQYKAKDTTTATTYVNGQPKLNVCQDILVNTYVTSRTISSGSSGGRGGGGFGGGGHGGHGGGH